MLLKFFLALCAIALAVSGGIFGARWAELRYASERSVLSFPGRLAAQTKRRPMILAGVYGLIFTWSMLTSGVVSGAESLGFAILTLLFVLVFQFFLVLFTITDFEQRVIFDRMLVPFAILGALSLPLLGHVAGDHLIAAVIGFAVFLALAFLTHGAIGGGDIKLITVLGLWLGTDQLLAVAIAGLLLSGLAALILLAMGRNQKDLSNYTPCFPLAAIVMTMV
ncbi:A24 family peptidase [uncultured Selenomonas sp.]|uniref:prepilin peptidase n=1 Tax=uncultured Selenomonas sp. TaxID=159275 RepID=UPI0025F2B585|nr:A24 family peptidase [uncultured Selenomonas sp.]